MYNFRPISDRICRMRKRYRDTMFTLDSERTMLVTDFHKQHKTLPAPLFRAQLQYEICSKMRMKRRR